MTKSTSKKVFRYLRAKKRYRGAIALSLALLLVAGALIYGNTKRGEPGKVVYQAEVSDDVSFGEPSIKITPESKSEACTRFTQQNIETIIGSETDGPKISIPNTENSQGFVSGCTYSTKDNSSSQVRYISIVVRTFKEPNKADQSYLALAGKEGEGKPRENRGLILSASNQVVLQRNDTLTVITVAKSRSDAGGIETILKEFLEMG